MIYLLDYLNMLYIRAGFFETAEDAMIWVQQNAPDQYSYFSVVEIPEARNDGELVIPQGKYKNYLNQS